MSDKFLWARGNVRHSTVSHKLEMTALKMLKTHMNITFNSDGSARPDKEEIQLLQHLPVCILPNKAQEQSNNIPALFSLLSSEPTKAFCNKWERGYTTQLSTDPFYKLMWQSTMRTISVFINIKVSNFVLSHIISRVFQIL
jgi:hypothetical protein